MGGEQQNASKEIPCTLEVKEEAGCPRRREEGVRGLIASLSGIIWTNQPGTQIATECTNGPTQCQNHLRAPCTQALQGLKSWITQHGARPGWVLLTQCYSRIEEPETHSNTQSGCVGAVIADLAGWGLFSSAVGHSEPVASLLWILMPCSVHVGCINTPACPNTLQIRQSLG